MPGPEAGGPTGWPTEFECPTCEGHGHFDVPVWSEWGADYDERPCDGCDGEGLLLWTMPSTGMAPWRKRERDAKRDELIAAMGAFDDEF